MIKNLIFDFDGTIADDIDQIFQCFNNLSNKYGYQKITKTIINNFRNNGANWLLNHLKVSKGEIPLLLSDIRLGMGDFIEASKPQPGIKQVLSSLKQKGLVLGILTTNSKENIQNFLDKNNLNVFDFIYESPGVFGKSQLLLGILKSRGVKISEILYIGDEDRDILAAKEIKMKSIGVTWGFNTRRLLSSTNPEFLINKPNEILKIV